MRRFRPLVIPFTVLFIVYLASRNISSETIIIRVGSSGLLAPLVFILLSFLTYVIAPLSGTPILFAGYHAFGNNIIFLSTIAAFMSAAVNFWIARKWGRPIVSKVVGKENVRKIDKLSENYGLFSLFVLRIFQGSIHDFVSYAAGLTTMKFVPYILVTLLASIPGTTFWYLLSLRVTTPEAFTAISLGIAFTFSAIFLLVKSVRMKINMHDTKDDINRLENHHKILFIHHSTGANLLRQGRVRETLKKINPNIELWDHSYNLYSFAPYLLGLLTYHTGLSDPTGGMTGKDLNIVLSNNSPKEYADIFSRIVTDQTLSAILQYDLIAFKNCYPTSKIRSEGQLERYKRYYEKIRDGVARFNNVFVLVTFPPIRKDLTSKENALRAVKLVDWLESNEFIGRSKNLKIFNLYALLVDKEGYLKKEYCPLIPLDSHPNRLANQKLGSKFANFLSKVF